ncbi:MULTISPECIES: DUF308 domain-containing protein [unclassified Arthrobacter]|uniref:DUF308 domain-containing protein n=1 Tax=unclassified Arthrobacter TaxID=235627 RepID=UPI001D1396C2|nr:MULTISPECIES: DUF308 domain-containing protein [unclassified Arthrobacter]MCC3275559.1 hypothetical protein [Arthrobacter sp. zg-Y20]MCC9177000.1 hypothetical protein [Arthrobacter sp. zg-Y750]MDK1315716.1 hypothetical protein [Arthrobacter sp. zg.Y20]MDK1326289.1 hypothetical protein [Arthrobacter sp. zg-Y1143]WIB06125.1 hypothetical protein QNO06_16670 [Arthrobacter sp. zg-Y20]
MAASHPVAPWGPMLVRAAVAAVYGVLTIFWQDPTEPVLAYAGGAYLLLSGAALLPMLSASRGHGTMRPFLLVEAAAYVLAGAATLIFASAEAFRPAAAAALILGGVIEIVLWVRHRRTFLPARDWLITGAAALVSGLLVPLVYDLGVRAMLGVTGGAAVVIAVIVAISALGARHDSRVAAQEQAKAVN